ncbi:MAG: hypothetical protein IIB54_13215 [Planctomycetes bacterium]|nr:hypothetical protein [Planctomycetota bacterium]
MIAEGNTSLADIARSSGFSLLELAAHICTARNLEALGRVVQLRAIEREMLLGQLKLDALMRLRELTDEVPAASADEVRAAEVMRKACVDILRGGNAVANIEGRSSGWNGGGPRSRGYHRESITPASEAEVLEALERLGEEKIEYEPRAQASGSVEPPSLGMPSDVSSDMPSEALKDVHASFDSISHNGPGARALGSYLPPPPETVTTRTGKMPVPLESCKTTGSRSSGGEDGTRFENGHPP